MIGRIRTSRDEVRFRICPAFSPPSFGQLHTSWGRVAQAACAYPIGNGFAMSASDSLVFEMQEAEDEGTVHPEPLVLKLVAPRLN